MKWASHRRRRGRNRSVVESSLPTRRALRFEALESRRLLDASGIVINEVLVNPHGADSPQEYIEIRSTAGIAETIPAGTYLLGIESDTFAANPGDVQNIFDLSGLTTGSNGVLVLVQKGSTLAVSLSATRVANTGSGVGWGNGATSSVHHIADGVMVDIENTSTTLMLVSAATAPTLTTDIDANNDGTPDGAAFASWTVLDSVGLLDGQDNDIGYGAINFRMGADGHSQSTVIEVGFNAGYVARKGNATGATADDWIAGYVAGAAPNWTLDSAQVSDPNYAGHALNHIGSANPNSIPMIAHAAGTFDEGSANTLTVAQLQATDLEQSAAALRFTVESLPTHGTLLKNGTLLAVADNFTQADVDAGHISYSHNGGETTSDSFGFTVVDGAGGSTSGAFSVTITPVNDVPTLVANLGLAIDEDVMVTITTSLLQVVDVDNSAEQLTYLLAAVPAHGTLAKNGISLAASESFTQHDIDLGLVTYQHNGVVALADQFSFTIVDGSGGTIESTTFTIAITQFNLPPTIAANEASVSVAEGTTATTSGTYSDPDVDAVILTASVGTVTDNGDGTWSWSYATTDGPEDTQTVTITIDDGLATAQTTFALEVINAAPAIAANASEVTAVEGETATNTGTFADVVADIVTLVASMGSVIDNGDGTWTWSYVTSDGPEDSQSVTITADDGIATSQVTFALAVTNAAPSIAANAIEVTVVEGETAINSGIFADVTADSATLSASIGTVTDNGDGTWSWAFATSDGPEDSQTVTITADDGHATSQVTFTLAVSNAAPAIATNLSEVTVAEGETATNSGTFADVPTDAVVLTASAGTVIDNGDGTWSWSWTTANGPEDSQTVTITADDGIATSVATFAVVVVDTTLTILASSSSVAANEGDTATNAGTLANFAPETLVLSATVGTIVNNGDGTWSWSFATTDGPEDSQTVTVTADDGTASAQTTFTLDVFNTTPSVAANASEVTVAEGETATNTGTFADVAADTVTLSASIGAIVDNGDGTWSWSLATSDGPEDSQAVTITADDGLATSQVTFALAVTNTAPSGAAALSEVTVDEGDTATNTGTYSDVAGDVVTLTASIGNVTNNSDGTWSWSCDTTGFVEYSLTVTITADDGLAASQVTFALEIIDAAPDIEADSSAITVDEGQTATNSGTLENFAAETLVLSASVGAVVNNGDGTWSWSLDTTDGPEDSQTVTITANDAVATAHVTFTLDVTNAAPAIAVSTGDVTVVEGETATNTGTFADVAADAVSLSASVGAVIDNGDGTWSWSWTTSDGPEDSQVVTVTADDGLATSQVTFNLTVTNAAPSVAANSNEVIVTVGETAFNTGTFGDVGADIVALTASIGTVTDNGDGTWSWSYATTSATTDTGPVTITATDSDNLLGTVVFNLIVNGPVGGGAGAVGALQDSPDSEWDADFLAALDGVFSELGSELS